LEQSAAGAKAVRGTYLKISAERKAEIGQRAAEQGVLATVRYDATKLLIPLVNVVTTFNLEGRHCFSTSHNAQPAGRKLINSGRDVFEQRICKIFSTKFSKTAICKNLDP